MVVANTALDVGSAKRPSPVAPFERIDAIDVLRGVALFGVLIVNIVTEFRVSIFAQLLGPAKGTPLDRAVDRFVAIAIEQKAFVVFSLLFGVGLGVQLDRVSMARGSRWRDPSSSTGGRP